MQNKSSIKYEELKADKGKSTSKLTINKMYASKFNIWGCDSRDILAATFSLIRYFFSASYIFKIFYFHSQFCENWLFFELFFLFSFSIFSFSATILLLMMMTVMIVFLNNLILSSYYCLSTTTTFISSSICIWSDKWYRISNLTC